MYYNYYIIIIIHCSSGSDRLPRRNLLQRSTNRPCLRRYITCVADRYWFSLEISIIVMPLYLYVHLLNIIIIEVGIIHCELFANLFRNDKHDDNNAGRFAGTAKRNLRNNMFHSFSRADSLRPVHDPLQSLHQYIIQ